MGKGEMFGDAAVAVEHQSWLDRLLGSMASACCGMLLFFFSFYLLGVNEKRAVQTAETIDEGRNAVVQTDSCTPMYNNEGHLVSMVGCAVDPGYFPGQYQPSGDGHPGTVPNTQMLKDLPTGDNVSITTGGVLGNDVLSWSRYGEQYQITETSSSHEIKNSDGSRTTITTYHYSKGWSSSHESWSCPSKMPMSRCVSQCMTDTYLSPSECSGGTSWTEVYADTATGQVDRIWLDNAGSPTQAPPTKLFIGDNDWGNSVIPSVGDSKDLAVDLVGGGHSLAGCGGYLQLSAGGSGSQINTDAKYRGGGGYGDGGGGGYGDGGGGGYSGGGGGGYGGAGGGGGGYGGACNAQIGDWRWKWTYRTVPLNGLSVLAKQKQAHEGRATFDAWGSSQTDVTWLAVSSIGMVQDGACNGACMLDEMESANTFMTWLFRILGWVLMIGALNAMLHWIAVTPAAIPCGIGNLIEDMIGCVLCLFSCCVGSALSMITIAIAWLFVRPMIAIPLLLLACAAAGVAVFLQMQHKAKKSKQAGMQPAPGGYGGTTTGMADTKNPYSNV